MKKFLLALFLFSAVHLSAQDTLYYRFYKGVQMIEIRTQPLKYNNGYHNLTRDNASLPPSIYLFRNEQGRVMQQFNTNGTEVIFSALKSPAQALPQLRNHREHDVTLTPRLHRYAFEGYTGYYLVRDHNGKTGIIDSLGNMVLPAVYNEITLTDSAFIFVQEGRYGLMDLSFKETVPAKFQKITRLHKSTPYYNVMENDQWGFINRKGVQVIPCAYQEVFASLYDPGYFGLQKNGKWALAGSKGQIILPFKYDRPLMFFSISIGEVVSNGLHGYVDSTCTEFIPTIYSSIDVSGNSFKAKKGSTYVLLDLKGKVICRSDMEVIDRLAPNTFVVRNNTAFGLIDSVGNEILPVKYGTFISTGQGTAIVALNAVTEEGYFDENTRWVLMDAEGKRISKRYHSIERIDNSLLRLYDGKKYGIMDVKGKVLLPVEYEYARGWSRDAVYFRDEHKHYVVNVHSFGKSFTAYDEEPAIYNGMARVKKGNHWGYIDSTGKLVVPIVYDACMNFQNRISVVVRNGKRMLINREGKQVMEETFDMAEEIRVGFIVTHKRKKFLVTGLNHPLVPMPYETVTPIYNYKTLLKVGNKEKFGMANIEGELLIPVEYDQLSDTRGMIFVKQGDKMGYYDMKGNLLVPALYESVVPTTDYQKNLFWTKQGEKWGVINYRNEIIYPFIYDNMPNFQNRHYLHFAEEYLAELSLTQRKTIELYYINVNGTLVGKRTVENTQKGFTVIYSKNSRYRKYGLRNWEGDTLLPPRYESIQRMEQNHFEVRDDRKLGLIDTMGKLVIPCQYEEIRHVGKKGLVSAKRENRWALYHTAKGMLLDAEYNYFGEMPGSDLIGFSKGGNFVPDQQGSTRGRYENGSIGVMDPEGKVLIEPEYDYIWVMDAAERLMVAKKGSQMCVIDSKGRIRSGFVTSATAAERWRMFKAG